MIDPHVHLRDWNQAAKETLRHGLGVAFRAGLDCVFEMPNTDPPLTTREAILRRIDDADAAVNGLGIRIFHGMYAGVTAVPRQIEEAVRAWRELYPRVVGLKMFAGQSTGNMGITGVDAQALVYRTLAALGYTGVLAVHCEKEELMRAEVWDPSQPVSHARARPPAAEVASVDDQTRLASQASFRGTLHVCHISTPWALDLLRNTHADPHRGSPRISPHRGSPRTAGDGPAEEAPGFRVTCGLTPHHALLDAAMMEETDGLLLKVNPPLRPKPLPAIMLRRLLDGQIDWIETDHAPHTIKDKKEGYASGVPGLPFYPRFLLMLRESGAAEGTVAELTHHAICRTFGITVARSGRSAEDGLAREYDYDPFALLAPRPEKEAP
jgi:dihydroorotase